jgi:hypothetical protein
VESRALVASPLYSQDPGSLADVAPSPASLVESGCKEEPMSEERKRLLDLPLEERLRILGMDQPVSPEEIKRRKEIGKMVDALREKIGPIGIPINDLLHLSDEELDAKYGRAKPQRS